ncbi:MULTISPECIES: hypothetical protein [unclassified Marinimicrobium]|jgi:hypothetical protein|uniref:hypothetical protein n=1 Tax=unclassified Marinimicrobium TaxID=2632100 RepID=UPI000C5BC648|nr:MULTISPECIES: hypothetical protein [unclassified Marinimicrobium]MAN52161.1 hypothetical protein [Marinimicrobium sp.]|tara:strand:- start:336 stop:653 length:318 start_codon:yes stop_codon:yes gene_type:complete
MLLTLLAIGAGTYVYINRKKVLKKINPASDQNFIYQSDLVQGGLNTPDDRGYTRGDKVFAFIDKLVPFWGDDDYADKVLGTEQKSLEDLKRDKQAGIDPGLYWWG